MRDRALRTIAQELTDLCGRWTVTASGVQGPGGTTVILDESYAEASPEILRIGFILDPEPDAEVIWDHVHGIGTSVEQAVERAATIWAQTVGATVIEIFMRSNEFGAHYGADDPDGLPGFHLVHGPAIGLGRIPADPLQHWLIDHPVLPALATTLTPALTLPNWNGIRLLFGGTTGAEVAEIQVNETVVVAASQTLGALDWPRLGESAYARAFLLAHPDPQAA
ncbi:hypothetical protein CEQ30_15785 [Nocardia brasiliensis]|nr:hypothetical protein CEQ30_15785 [Nocardia brasiliensis]